MRDASGREAFIRMLSAPPAPSVDEDRAMIRARAHFAIAEAGALRERATAVSQWAREAMLVTLLTRAEQEGKAPATSQLKRKLDRASCESTDEPMARMQVACDGGKHLEVMAPDFLEHISEGAPCHQCRAEAVDWFLLRRVNGSWKIAGRMAVLAPTGCGLCFAS